MRELILFLSKEEIENIVKTLALTISTHYLCKELIVVGVLNGALLFMSDLVRHLNPSIPVKMDTIRVKSYGSSSSSSGHIELTKDIEMDIAGRDVLIVEDIIDSGLTLKFLLEHFILKNPSSIKVCALINKTVRREKDIMIDYPGFTVQTDFLVGYGLDHDENFRHLPEIYSLRL
ncbi:MAG: hypoxanthine phosphoribosyltransferase [Patescibacteria group bacterium]